jgi:chlorobactene glucosyltransferase
MDPATLNAGMSAINLTMAVILAGVLGVWLYFLTYMTKSFRLAPKIEEFQLIRGNGNGSKKVSVILPARNEEKYIARCLDTLIAQDYPNFEVIAINDNSTDTTGEIMQSYASKDHRIVYVHSPDKPKDWAGKNWACYHGYKKASGEYLFFTDADTRHASNVISLVINHMVSQNLDALTAIPRLLCKDFWTKITLPALSTFLHTRFSPLRVNDPKHKTGYFFGSCFMITRKTYEAVGTHEGVKQELVEDGALGNKVKSAGFRMKMVRGEKYVEAIWARDLTTLWHGLRRLVVPLYHQGHKDAHMVAVAVFFIMFAPFLFMAYSIPVFMLALDGVVGASATILLGINAVAIGLLLTTTAIQSKLGVLQSPLYALGSPLSGALIYFGFASAIVDARKTGSVRWRDRQYTVSEKQDFLH